VGHRGDGVYKLSSDQSIYRPNLSKRLGGLDDSYFEVFWSGRFAFKRFHWLK